MSRLTDDPNDPDLTRGSDTAPVAQAPAYLVLSAEERARGFVRPVRKSYIHDGNEDNAGCGTVTTMSTEIAETYARDPRFYGATYCVACKMHRPVGPAGEFSWDNGGGKVGT